MSAENENGDVETRNEGAVATGTDRLVDLYREMVLVRLFEEATQRAFRQGKIGGYLHVYIGQEAVATGFLDSFKEGDRAITAYRDHPHVLLGVATRLFGDLDAASAAFERTRVIDAEGVTHLRFRLVR